MPPSIRTFRLFRYASVNNTHIIGNGEISVNTNNTVTYFVGTRRHLNESEIINCTNSTDININRTTTSNTVFDIYIGGIVAYGYGNMSKIDKVLNKGKIDYNFDLNNTSTSSYTWNHYIGGVGGYLNRGVTLENSGHVNHINILSDAKGYANRSNIYSGGIVGYMAGSSAYPIIARKSYNRGEVNVTLKTNHTYTSSSYSMNSYLYAGGIAGYSSAYNTISDCYNRGNIIPVLFANSSYSAPYATNYAYVLEF